MDYTKITEHIREKFLQSELDGQLKDFLSSDCPVMIYGAGRQARLVIDFCNMFNKKLCALLTSGSTQRWGLLPREDELPLYTMGDLPEKINLAEYDILLGVNSSLNEEIIPALQAAGASHVYAPKDWNKENDRIRYLFYRSYFEWHGADFHTDAEGEEILCYRKDDMDFRTYFPKDPLFRANVLGEFGNIVLPALFHDERICCLGPYEKEPYVLLKRGDIVLDLGASVGLFSCVAAAKGCTVYAFEPGNIPVYRFLSKNADLYEEIHVMPFAVGEKNGVSPFYYNDNTERDMDLCRSSVHRHLDRSFRETQVDMVTLDRFVEEHSIPRIDFIKSHIEYAENYMLMGAQRILRDSFPIFSAYSKKKLAGKDVEEVERLLREGNPGYHIEYEKRRVYAYRGE